MNKTTLFISKYKKTIYSGLVFSSFFFLLGFVGHYQVPKIKKWLLIEVEKQSKKYSPIRVWAQDADFNLFPIGATFYEVRLLPKKEFAAIIEPTTLKQVSISLSPWALFKAQLRIGTLIINGANLSITVPPQNFKNSSAFSLEIIEQIPIDKIVIKNTDLKVHVVEHKLTTLAKNLNLKIENRFSSLRTRLNTARIELENPNGRIDFGVNANFLIDDDGIYVSQLELKHRQSQVIITGSGSGELFKNKLNVIQAKIMATTMLPDIHSLIKKLNISDHLPVLKGSLNVDVDMNYDLNKNELRSSLGLRTQKLAIAETNLGAVNLTTKITENGFNSLNAEIKNYFGSATIQKASLDLKTHAFSGVIGTTELEFSRFLNAIGVGQVPVYTTVMGEFPCSGAIQPKITANCSGGFSGKKISIDNGSSDPVEIVAFENYSADGRISIDEEKVQYSANLKIGKSTGKSDGIINYKTGFKINYSTPLLHLSDITNLAQIKPEGTIAIRGTTKGTSKTATVDLSANGDDLWIFDYMLGKTSFAMKLKKGILHFTDLNGQLNTTQYKAKVDLNLNNNHIAAQASLPFVDLQDLQTSVKRKVAVPISISGTGSANIDIDGPLSLSKLSYNLASTFFRGSIADETYDQIKFDITSSSGDVKTKNVKLKKGQSQITATGGVNPEGKIQLDISGNKFLIEQSENINKLKLNLAGNIDFSVKLSHHILKPDIELSGIFSNTYVGEEEAQNSNFFLKYTEHNLLAGIKLLGHSLDITYERSRLEPALSKLDIKASAWNFAQTFSIFSDSLRAGNYSTSMSGKVTLEWPNSNWKLFSGNILLNNLYLKNGRVEMNSTNPMQLTASNGIIKAHNFEITGEESFLRLTSESENSSNLNLTLSGRIDLSLATLLTPFLDDLRGRSKFSFNMTGPITSPYTAGTLYLENALVKLKDFPHALEQINGDAIINHEKIIVNSLKGRIAGGPFSSSGKINLQGVTHVDVDFRGQFLDSRFNVPDGYRTRGSGDFSISGQWFPYTIGVNYNVESGSIEQLGETRERVTKDIKPSVYLPKFLSAQRFSPINLDVNVNLKRYIPVKMNVSRINILTDVIGQLNISGPPEATLLLGKINVQKGGRINFRNNTFNILSGTVNYEKSSPENPILSVSADSKITAFIGENETRDYDVNMRVQGQAQNPTITLSSTPSLPETELISLVTLGFISSAATASTSEEDDSGKLASTSTQLGVATATEQLGLNRLLDQNFGVKFDFNSSYDTTDKAQKNRFTLRKQWTPKFGTSATREVGKTNTNNVKAEYRINNKVSVIGEWEGQEATASGQNQTSDEERNIFGLDLEYKVEFK